MGGLWSMWQYRDSHDWCDFDLQMSGRIEEAYAMGEVACSLRGQNGWCECNLRNMSMRQYDGTFDLRRVRAPVLSADEIRPTTSPTTLGSSDSNAKLLPSLSDCGELGEVTFLTTSHWGDVLAPGFYSSED